MAGVADELRRLLSIPPASLAAHLRNNPIAVAHAVLQSLRDEGDPQFMFLRTVIELSTSTWDPNQEEMLFHCITGVRQVSLCTNWNSCSKTFLDSIRNFFMTIGRGLHQSRTCRLACYTLSAAFWKRDWNEGASERKLTAPSQQEQALLLNIQQSGHQIPQIQDISQLFDSLHTNFKNNKVAIASYLTCLVGEFSGNSAVTYRLPFEFHEVAHESFETTGALSRCLSMAMPMLSIVIQGENTEETVAVLRLIVEILSWEFGRLTSWISTTNQTFIRPPVEWRSQLVQGALCNAIVHAHEKTQRIELQQCLRQLLLALASLHGLIIPDEQTARTSFASSLCECALQLLSTAASRLSSNSDNDHAFIVESLQILERIVSNYGLSTLTCVPTFTALMGGLVKIGENLWADHIRQCEHNNGAFVDEWREDALKLVLGASVLLCGDPWILYSSSSPRESQQLLSGVLSPLYRAFVNGRTRVYALEEYFSAANGDDLDETHERLAEEDLMEEVASVACIGRLSMASGVPCLSNLFSRVIPPLDEAWRMEGEVSPHIAASLEQARMLNLAITSLLSDDNKGEEPFIPECIVQQCKESSHLAAEISAVVDSVMKLTECQLQMIPASPSNPRLSPLLAMSFLEFFERWAPAYVFPRASTSAWSSPEQANKVLQFCASICVRYICYWPQEKGVHVRAANLLRSLADRGPCFRSILVGLQPVKELVQYHCMTSSTRHSASQEEINALLAGHGSVTSPPLVQGYMRLPYHQKGRLLTVILVICCDPDNAMSTSLVNAAINAVHAAIDSLSSALKSGSVRSEDLQAKEMACLSVELMSGIARVGDIDSAYKAPELLTKYLHDLAALMRLFGSDIAVCEILLCFFRDYAESFIATLNKENSAVLFQSCADLLKEYSHHQIQHRSVAKKSSAEVDAEEEQAYNDILCAIQLLINLGTKDFVDACGSSDRIGTDQVAGVLFFGLQQILPLMTQGLLEYPSLCVQFFELVGFLAETYPHQVCMLPYDLFHRIFESMLYGMSHHSARVSKCCLHGITSLFKEQNSSKAMQTHLHSHAEIYDECVHKIFVSVVFQDHIIDRMESARSAILQLGAADFARMQGLVKKIASSVHLSQQQRLLTAFEKLLRPEVVVKATATGLEGRTNRTAFKELFTEFVKDIQSFLVMR